MAVCLWVERVRRSRRTVDCVHFAAAKLKKSILKLHELLTFVRFSDLLAMCVLEVDGCSGLAGLARWAKPLLHSPFSAATQKQGA